MEGYKYATWILVVITIILVIVLVRKDNETVTDTFTDVNELIEECRTDLAAWESEFGGMATTTPAAEEELQDIIERCLGDIESSQNAI